MVEWCREEVEQRLAEHVVKGQRQLEESTDKWTDTEPNKYLICFNMYLGSLLCSLLLLR